MNETKPNLDQDSTKPEQRVTESPWDTSSNNKNTESQKQPQMQPEPAKVGKKETGFLAKIKTFWANLSKGQRILLVSSAVLALLAIVAAVVLLFKFDAYLFPSSLVGNVKDDQGEAIGAAQICVSNKCINSADDGSYILGDLKYGTSDLKVEAKNYKAQERKVNLNRGRNRLDITLNPIGFGTIKGELATDAKELNFENLKIYLDDEELEIDGNGAFHSDDIGIGEYKLKIESPDYVDEEIDIEIKPGEQDLGQIQLTPAGDIGSKVVDWLSLEGLEMAEVKAGETESKTARDGTLELKDLSLGAKTSVEVQKEGYLTKTFEIEISQGLNEVPDLEMVRVGRVVYVSNRMGNQNIYISNYDGSDEKMLSDNQGDSYSPYLTSDGLTVRFISTREQVKNTQGYTVPLAYSVASSGGEITKGSQTNYEDYGHIGSYDFQSMKRIYFKNIYDYTSETYTAELYFGNLDGTDTKKLVQIDGYSNTAAIANNADFIIYGADDGLYYLNPANSDTRKILDVSSGDGVYPLDISPDRKSTLVSFYSESEGKWDLWIVGIFSNYKVRITNTSSEEMQARFTPDGNNITFLSSRDGKADVYLIGLDGQNERKVTSDGKIDDYFWGTDSLLFYNSEESMWVIDADKPKKAQKVTDSVLGTYYSSHYYCCD